MSEMEKVLQALISESVSSTMPFRTVLIERLLPLLEAGEECYEKLSPLAYSSHSGIAIRYEAAKRKALDGAG